MPKEKTCQLCDETASRKLPNGVRVCEICYGKRNPLLKFGLARSVWQQRSMLPDEVRKKVVENGPPPRMDRAYHNRALRYMYDMLDPLKRKKYETLIQDDSS